MEERKRRYEEKMEREEEQVRMKKAERELKVWEMSQLGVMKEEQSKEVRLKHEAMVRQRMEEASRKMEMKDSLSQQVRGV